MKIIYAGYWIGGFGLGESMEERPSLLNAVTVSQIFFIRKIQVFPLFGQWITGSVV